MALITMESALVKSDPKYNVLRQLWFRDLIGHINQIETFGQVSQDGVPFILVDGIPHIVSLKGVSWFTPYGLSANRRAIGELKVGRWAPEDFFFGPMTTRTHLMIDRPVNLVSPPRIWLRKTINQEKPIQEKAVQEKVVEEKPVHRETVQQQSIQAKPVELKPIQAKPVQEKTIQERQIQEKPVQAKPIQWNPVEEKPVQKKPVQAKLAQTNNLKRKRASENSSKADETPKMPGINFSGIVVPPDDAPDAKIVLVELGPEMHNRKSYVIHPYMAEHVPQYKAAFERPAKVFLDATEHLEAVTLQTYDDFMNCLKRGTISEMHFMLLTDVEKWRRLAFFYVLADHKKCLFVKNKINQYLHLLINMSGSNRLPSKEMVSYIYRNTFAGAAIRKYVVTQRLSRADSSFDTNHATYARRWTRNDWTDEQMDEDLSTYDWEFLSELAGRAIRQLHAPDLPTRVSQRVAIETLILDTE